MPFPYFPTDLATFTTKVDNVSTVLAEHVNSLQIELLAVEGALGTGVGTTGTTTASRLSTLETTAGALATTYVAKSQTVSGSVGVTLTSGSGNTSDLVQTKAYGGVTGFRVDKDGAPYVGTNAVVTEASSSYTSLQSDVSTLQTSVSGLSADVFVNPLLIAGM